MRTIVILAALLARRPAGGPGAGQARLRQAGRHRRRRSSTSPRTTGKDPRRLGIGRAPTISPDGRWVAFVTVPSGGSDMDTVVLQRLEAGSQRLVMRSQRDRLAALLARLRAGSRRSPTASACASTTSPPTRCASPPRATSAATRSRPTPSSIVFGEAAGEDFQARERPLRRARRMGGAEPERLTTLRDAREPGLGPEEIVFDRFKRRADDAPAYNLWALDPAAPDGLRRLTQLTIPPLVSGLVPLEVSADGAPDARRLHRPGHRGRLHRRDADRRARARSRPTSRAASSASTSPRDGKTILAPHRRPGPGRRARRRHACPTAAASRRSSSRTPRTRTGRADARARR